MTGGGTWGAFGFPKSSYKDLGVAFCPEDHLEKVLFRLVAWLIYGTWGAFFWGGGTWGASGVPKSLSKQLGLGSWPEDHLVKVLLRMVATVVYGTWGACFRVPGGPLGGPGGTLEFM